MNVRMRAVVESQGAYFDNVHQKNILESKSDVYIIVIYHVYDKYMSYKKF